MQLTKHIGCLLALVFATASAFAGDESVRPNFWFDATLAAELGQGWSGSTGSDYWSFANNVGKLNNMSATGENEYLTFTATPKNLPGDKSTIKTSVKFTPMDKADFFTEQGNVPTIPDGAKGGLTIIEDSDAATPTTKFYGIVGGTDTNGGVWTELDGDTSVALNGQVEVEVKIWENNGKHISYKITPVDDQQGEAFYLTLNGKSDLTAKFTGTTISSVSYKGVCEIASLQGDAQDELWTLTSKVIANAVVTLAIDDVDVPLVDGNKFKAQKGSAVLTYTLPQTSALRFYDATGLGGFTKSSVARNIEGENNLNFTEEFENVTATEPVAQNGSDFYNSIAAAVGGAGNTVNVLKDADETVTIGKAIELTAESNVDIKGSILLAENTDAGVLTIKSGNYDCTIDKKFTAATLILMGGFYKQGKDMLAPYCAADYFADSTGTEPYATQVVEGQLIDDKDIPAVKLDPEELAKIPAGEDKATYLKGESLPGVKRWGSLALGFKMDPGEGDDKPEVGVAAGSTANTIALENNFKVDGAVFKVDGNEKKVIDLDFSADNVVKHDVTVEVGGKIAMTTQIGANKVAKKTTGRTLVTVPWAESNASAVQTVATLFNTASLSENDKVEVYDSATDVYKTFIWNGTAWSGINEIDGQPVNISAGETELQLGQAVWFTGSAGAVQAGTVAAAVTPQVAAGKWGLVANPVSAAAEKSLSAIITEPIAGDIAQVMDPTTGKSTIYSYKQDKWGYDGFVNGRPQFVESVPNIAPGQALWFSNSDKNPENKRTLNFSDVAK